MEYSAFLVEGVSPRWESRVLRKRPAVNLTPQLLFPVSVSGQASSSTRATRGCHGARTSTSKSVKVKDAKHPHECRVCHEHVGARCKVHCGQPVVYCSGQMAPRRANACYRREGHRTSRGITHNGSVYLRCSQCECVFLV